MLKTYLKLTIPALIFILVFAYFSSDITHYEDLMSYLKQTFFTPQDPFADNLPSIH